jgi:hypothetical protein
MGSDLSRVSYTGYANLFSLAIFLTLSRPIIFIKALGYIEQKNEMIKYRSMIYRA